MNINFKWALSSWKSFKVSLDRAPSRYQATIISCLLLVPQTHFMLISESDPLQWKKWSHLPTKFSSKLHASFPWFSSSMENMYILAETNTSTCAGWISSLLSWLLLLFLHLCTSSNYLFQMDHCFFSWLCPAACGILSFPSRNWT